MSRPKRIDIPFSLYHVYSRTNSGDRAFLDRRDREKFLEYLSKYLDIFDFRLHAFCLLSNHFHLLLESTDRPALSEFMRRLLTAYTVYFNRRRSRHGHLFQGRFKSHIVDKSSYLLALSRYIHLNPVRLSKSCDAEHFEGSSLRWYINGGEPPYLYTKEVLSWFKGDREKYKDFVYEGLNERTKPEIVNQRYIGGEAFRKRISSRMKFLETRGSRVDKVSRKRYFLQKEQDLKRADLITQKVREYFGLYSLNLKKELWGRGTINSARICLFLLLRDILPWTAKQIVTYLGLKSQSSLSYYTKRAKNDKNMLNDITRLKTVIKKELI